MFSMDGTQEKWNCRGKLLHTYPLLRGRILPIFFPSITFHFFYYHTINLHLGIYISIFEQFFFSVAWNMNLSQYYRNIGYFEEIYTCENLTNWKRYKIWECCKTWSGVWSLFWSGVWSQFWCQFWVDFKFNIALIIYIPIENRHKKRSNELKIFGGRLSSVLT